MHDSNRQRFHLNCETPVGWLRTVSDGSHLIHLVWNQIGWTDPDRPDRVSRETIARLMAYFAGQRTNFTISLRPTKISPTRQHWRNIMARISYGTATGAPNVARAAGTACAANPLAIVYPCHRIVRKNGALIHYGGGNQLAPNHKDNAAHKGF